MEFNHPIKPEMVQGWLDSFDKMKEKVTCITMNVVDYADLRKFNPEVLDIETNSALWKSGLMATVYGVQIRISRQIRPDRFLIKRECEHPTRELENLFGPCLDSNKLELCHHEHCIAVWEVMES
jgi:hypothetical protein